MFAALSRGTMLARSFATTCRAAASAFGRAAAAPSLARPFSSAADIPRLLHELEVTDWTSHLDHGLETEVHAALQANGDHPEASKLALYMETAIDTEGFAEILSELKSGIQDPKLWTATVVGGGQAAPALSDAVSQQAKDAIEDYAMFVDAIPDADAKVKVSRELGQQVATLRGQVSFADYSSTMPAITTDGFDPATILGGDDPAISGGAQPKQWNAGNDGDLDMAPEKTAAAAAAGDARLVDILEKEGTSAAGAWRNHPGKRLDVPGKLNPAALAHGGTVRGYVPLKGILTGSKEGSVLGEGEKRDGMSAAVFDGMEHPGKNAVVEEHVTLTCEHGEIVDKKTRQKIE